MARKIPDITQHVATRVRVTRMFLKLSIEEASELLSIPAWLLSYKENGLLNFSYQELLEMERVYKVAWTVFFQDYAGDFEDFGGTLALDPNSLARPATQQGSDLIMGYLARAQFERSGADLEHEGAWIDSRFPSSHIQNPPDIARRWSGA